MYCGLFRAARVLAYAAFCVVAAGSYMAADAQTGSAAETPQTSIQWAKPLKGGPVRVAAVVPEDGLGDLDALEAGFDLKLVRFAFGDRGTAPGDAIAAALKSKCDVLIVSAVPLADLPDTAREVLASHIRGGMGLLWVVFATSGKSELGGLLSPLGLQAASPQPDFGARTGAASLTDLRPGFDDATAYEGPASRAAELRFWRGRPAGHALLSLTPTDALDAPMSVESYRAIVGRALLWAARRDPEAALLRIEDRASQGPSELTTPPQLPQQFIERMKQAAVPRVLRPYAVALDRPAPRKYSLQVQARYPERGIRWSYAADEGVAKGAREVQFAAPTGEGRCLLDVWLMDGAKVVDWVTQSFDLQEVPSLGTVTFDHAAVERNDRLRVSAQVRGRMASPSESSARPRDVLFVRVTDSLGRAVATQDAKVPTEAAEVVAELSLSDLLTPYVRAEVFAATAGDSPLTSWIEERAAYRSTHIAVRLPLPPGLAIIVDEPGEGSFAGSARRKALAARGVDYIYPGLEADLGNVASDGLRAIGRLEGQGVDLSGALDARTKAGAALRQVASRYASPRPGLYVGEANRLAAEQIESKRALVENVVREIDPRGVVALLDGDFSAAGAGGFRVVRADPALFESTPAGGGFVAVRASLGEGEIDRARWLPWFCAIEQANALWLDGASATGNAENLDAALTAARDVREGYDVLFARARRVPKSDDAALVASKEFDGIAARFELGKAIVFGCVASPEASQAANLWASAVKESRVYDPMASEPRPVRSVKLKLRAGDAAVACILPYEVTRVALEFAKEIAQGKRLTVNARVKTRGALPGDHVLRMNCYDPNGRRLDHYGRTIYARDGAGATWIPLAFNEAPGSYRIVVRDVMTGIASEDWFMVEPPASANAAAPR